MSVGRGLHVFRYVSFKGAGAPAVARVVPSNEAVTLVGMPGRELGVLQRPGDCLVLRAERAVDVEVGLRRGSSNGTLDASFRVEPIALADEEAPVAAAAPAAPVSFMAHLARRGDVAFDQNIWAGGPDAPSIVEGLQIIGGGDAARLELQVLVAGRPPRWSEWVGAGQYAGTRGHGLSLLGFRLRLAGDSTGREIAAEALFLGALVAAQRGREVEFVSASGVDPLVGVKVALQPARIAAAETYERNKEPRVRVFRASSPR